MFGRNFVGGYGCLQKNAVKVKMANIMLSWSACFHAALSFPGRVSEVVLPCAPGGLSHPCTFIDCNLYT